MLAPLYPHPHIPTHTHTLTPSQWRYQLHYNGDWSQLGTTATPPVLHGGCSKGGEKEETSCRPKYELHPVRGQYRTRILQTKYLFIEYCNVMSITAPQDAHKLVLQVAELLTASLSGLPRHEINYITFSTGLKNKWKCCHVFTIVCKWKEPISSDAGIKKKCYIPHVEDQTLTVGPPHTANLAHVTTS